MIQVYNWANICLFHWRIYASLGLNELSAMIDGVADAELKYLDLTFCSVADMGNVLSLNWEVELVECISF